MSLSVFVVNVVARENSLRNFRSIQKNFCAWPLSFSCHENFVLTEFEIYNSVLFQNLKYITVICCFGILP